MSDESSPWNKGMGHNELERIWTTKAGYPAICVMVRGSHRCGYVGLPPDHTLHKISYEECRYDIEVHGGITFSGALSGVMTYQGTPVRSLETVFWYGFDCAHSGDLVRGLPDELRALYNLGPPRGIERTVDYVVAECEKLAAQLKDIDDGKGKYWGNTSQLGTSTP